MAKNYEEIALALAAVCQCARLVNELAQTGKTDWVSAGPLLDSVLLLDAQTTESLYGGVNNLRPGLLTLADQLNLQHQKRDAQISRYIANLLNIERLLNKRNDIRDLIGVRLQQSQRLRTHLPDDWDALINSLAGIYSDSISTLSLRIQVRGESLHLQSKENQARIRALLLAGVRAAVLWRQLGGRRRQFIFSRRHLLTAVQQLLRK